MNNRIATNSRISYKRVGGVFLTIVVLGATLPHGTIWSSTARATTQNRRFTDNPYVPRLVVGKAVAEMKKTFKCPKALIVGFRGSGEKPDEFKTNDVDQLSNAGQTYKNWVAETGFKPLPKYKKEMYKEATSALYTQIFGRTVGRYVEINRQLISKENNWDISDVGIWSVGVDDLEFSTADIPQSAYHAPDLPNKKINILKWFRWLSDVTDSTVQMEGYLVFRKSGAVNTGFYHAMLLFREFCPKLESLSLIGYSQGAVVARFVAASSLILQPTEANPSLQGNKKIYRTSLLLIADPMFDGYQEQLFVPQGQKSELVTRGQTGSLRKTWFCAPAFRYEKPCSKNGINFEFKALDRFARITTYCTPNDSVCSPSYNILRFGSDSRRHSSFYRKEKDEGIRNVLLWETTVKP